LLPAILIDRVGHGRVVSNQIESNRILPKNLRVASCRLDRSVRLARSTGPARKVQASGRTQRRMFGFRGGTALSSPSPDRLPDLRLMTPSDYDRAFLTKPLRNCCTAQSCQIIGSSPTTPSAPFDGAQWRSQWPRSSWPSSSRGCQDRFPRLRRHRPAVPFHKSQPRGKSPRRVRFPPRAKFPVSSRATQAELPE
jgi:hypothetical protein